MADPSPRVDRRKVRTRAALVEAAQRIFAERGTTDVSIQQITEIADVGFGSFYNYFSTKAELFHTAITELLETHARVHDALLEGEPDPAARFAIGTRLTARLIETDPLLAKVIMNSPISVALAREGAAARARRDIEAAVAVGRFQVDSVVVAVGMTAACVVTSIRLCLLDESLVVSDVADQTALSLLRMFRVEETEAQRLVALPLPELPAS